MNTLSYRDYIGTVSFSEKDGVFLGKTEGIDGLVNFDGESVAELTEAFHEAVDDYTAYCEEEGLPLHMSYSGNLNIRINQFGNTQPPGIVCQAKGSFAEWVIPR